MPYQFERRRFKRFNKLLVSVNYTRQIPHQARRGYRMANMQYLCTGTWQVRSYQQQSLTSLSQGLPEW